MIEEIAASQANTENPALDFSDGNNDTIKLKSPVLYNGNTVEILSFDWGKLTGKDALAIESELSRSGIPVVVPGLTGQYIIRAAARACTQKIGIDIFEDMSLTDYNRVRSATRSFLMKSES